MPGDHNRSVSISPTLVRAGTYQNVVPDTCEATFDVRVPPKMRVSEAADSLRDRAKVMKDGTSVHVSFEEKTDPYEVDINSRLVRAFQRAILTRMKTSQHW